MNYADHNAPPRHFRPLSEHERRAVLARIDAAERETMDSFPAPLAGDPYLLRTGPAQALAQAAPKPSPAPLRMIKPAPAPTACGFGTCALTPECTRSCRYREADKALRGHYSERQGQPQRAAMPAPKVDQRLRRIVWTGIALYMVAAGSLFAWYFTH